MSVISALLDIASIIYFFGGFPQVISTFKNRRESLKPISLTTLITYLAGGILFAVGNAHFGAYIASLLNIASCVSFGLQIYWKVKSQ